MCIRDRLNEELDKEYLGDSGLMNNLAWVLATSPMDDVRDGERAIELATTAAELTDFKKAFILSTLASGYAEVGEFEKAREWMRKAIEVNRADLEVIKKAETFENEQDREARMKIEDDQLESLKKELASYEMEKPWREKQTSEKEAAAEKEAVEQDADKKDEDGDEEDEGSEKGTTEEQESEAEMSDAETEEDADEDEEAEDSTD